MRGPQFTPSVLHAMASAVGAPPRLATIAAGGNKFELASHALPRLRIDHAKCPRCRYRFSGWIGLQHVDHALNLFAQIPCRGAGDVIQLR